MSNNRVRGGQKTAATLKAKDPDYYRKIGALGGRAGGSPKGLFAHGKVDPRQAGIKGGAAGKRGPFVEDNTEFGEGFTEFGEGFDALTWKDKLTRRFK